MCCYSRVSLQTGFGPFSPIFYQVRTKYAQKSEICKKNAFHVDFRIFRIGDENWELTVLSDL